MTKRQRLEELRQKFNDTAAELSALDEPGSHTPTSELVKAAQLAGRLAVIRAEFDVVRGADCNGL